MFFKKKKKEKKKGKKKVEKEDKLTLLKKQVLKRIKLIEEQIFEDKIEDGFINLFHTIREFFATIAKIKYEFTYEELINEINKKKVPPELKNKINEFAKNISVIEYSDRTLSKQLLKDSLVEFRHIFNILTKRPRKKKEGPRKLKLEKLYKLNEHLIKVLHVLKLYKTEEEKREILRKRKIEEKEKEKEVKLLKEKYRKKTNIENLATKAKEYIQNKNIKAAKKTYILLNRLYQNSTPEEKEQLYDKVKDIYHEIVAYTSLYPKEILKLEKIKVSEEKLNNLILNIYDNIKKKNIKKAKMIYAIGYKLYTKLSLPERKKIYPKLRKIHNLLNAYK